MKKSKLIKILNSPNENNFYLIGETAYNHEGSLRHLYKMVDELSESMVDAVKFHLLLNLESYMEKKHPLIKQFRGWLFSKKEWQKLINYSLKKGLEVIALCDDEESIDFLLKNKLKIVGIELHASSLNDYFMMERLLDYKGVIILGIGGSTLEEIKYAVNFFRSKGKKNILLMYGFQAYPTNYEEINLRKMLRIKEIFNVEVGYADHTAFNNKFNESISVIGYVLGAKVLEKHYTPDWGVKRVDFQSAISKEQMIKIKKYLELIKKVLGDGRLVMSKAEKKYGKIGPMKKAIVVKRKIKKGEKLQFQDLWFKRTIDETFIRQNQIWSLVGGEALKDIAKDEVVDFKKIRPVSQNYE